MAGLAWPRRLATVRRSWPLPIASVADPERAATDRQRRERLHDAVRALPLGLRQAYAATGQVTLARQLGGRRVNTYTAGGTIVRDVTTAEPSLDSPMLMRTSFSVRPLPPTSMLPWAMA